MNHSNVPYRIRTLPRAFLLALVVTGLSLENRHKLQDLEKLQANMRQRYG